MKAGDDKPASELVANPRLGVAGFPVEVAPMHDKWRCATGGQIGLEDRLLDFGNEIGLKIIAPASLIVLLAVIAFSVNVFLKQPSTNT